VESGGDHDQFRDVITELFVRAVAKHVYNPEEETAPIQAGLDPHHAFDGVLNDLLRCSCVVEPTDLNQLGSRNEALTPALPEEVVKAIGEAL